MKYTRKNNYSKSNTFKSLLLAGLCSFNLPIYASVNLEYVQSRDFTIQMSNTTVREVLDYIENNSDFVFLYDKNAVNLDKRVNVNLKSRPVQEILNESLQGQNVVYEINDRQITLRKASASEAQTVRQTKVTIKGIVMDATGPIIGANVLVKGTTNGVITGFEGDFTLDVNPKDILQISYLGYKTLEIPIKDQREFTIILKEDSEMLGDVVVVGYGIQKKANLSGSVAQVDSKTLESRPIQNLSTGIQGLMAGVTVTNGGGAPGMDGGTIRVRGVGTLNSADPYILVDGVETSTMNQINPNDVESISVLKDAASAAIYGSKASNGVILITTKRGKIGKPRISYNGYVGFQKPAKLIDRLGSYDYARLYSGAMEAEGLKPRFDEEEIQKFKDGNDPLYPNTDWYDEIYQTGVQHSHSVSVNGGTDDVKYMGAVSYLHQTGILPHAMRRQFSGRTNLDVKLSSRLNARLNLAYINNNYSDPTDSYTGGGSYQIINLASKMAPWIVGRYEDGTYGTISDGSPLAWLDAKQTVDRMNQNFTGSLSLDYQILDELKATVTGSYVNNQQHYKEFRKEIIYNPNKKSNPNQLDERFYGWERGTFDALLNYDKQFDVHGLKAMAGYHLEKYNYRENQSIRKNFPTNDLDDMNAGDAATQTNSGYTRELAMISWFARLNYDYSGKYLFEANIRADASSRFSDGNRWGYFPSFSAAWRISEENFMESSRDWLDNLKIRTSWGLLGNQNALSDYYPWLNTYQLDGKYNFGSGLKTGYYLDSYKLSTISWEKACTWGIGVDASFFNCVDLSVDFYDRKTTGIIMDVPVPKEFGLKPYKDNVGEMLNRGVEVTLGYHKKWGKWTLGATGNFAYNKNELLDLGGVDYMVDPGDKYKRRQIGERLNSYYAYKTNGFFQSDEEAQAWMDKYSKLPGYPFGTRKFKGGDLIYQDTDGVEGITENDRVLLGSMDPAWTFGLNLNAGYKGWDISMMFSGAANVSRMFTNPGDFNGDMARPTTLWLDAWTPDNKNAEMPRVAYDKTSPSHPWNAMSDFWIQDASYLRLQNLQVGYTFSTKCLKALHVENLRMYYSAENLFTIDNMMVNVDPESRDTNGNGYPLLQTHSIGVSLTF